jgi:uncharacterized protein YbaA (DUF1428 family)
MMGYMDVWVMPVRKDRLEDYKALAVTYATVWKDHGALAVTEALGEGLAWGAVTSFPRAVQLADDEVCVLWMMRFADKAAHDRAVEAVMADPRLADVDMGMVDGARLFFGGFVPFVDE